MAEIVKTPDVLGGKARLDGRRVSVFQIGEMYTEAGDAPEDIADQLGVSLADVHAALAYYFEHPDEMSAIRDRDEGYVNTLRERSKAPEKLTGE